MIIHGDSLEELKKLPDNSVDSIVTDAPYGLGNEPDPTEVLKDWIDHGYHEVKSKGGFMGKEWDAFVPQPLLWKEVIRVLKPGGHALVFAGTRTQDWMAMSLRFAGFEIRDTIAWMYGSGFPKSTDISKQIDKKAGAEREFVGKYQYPDGSGDRRVAACGSQTTIGRVSGSFDITAPSTDEAKKFQGWGTALKPSQEPIIVARKPLGEKTLAENTLKWGTGGINIDECRIGTDWQTDPNKRGWQGRHLSHEGGSVKFVDHNKELSMPNSAGRWPANTILQHSPECKRIGTKEVEGYTINRWDDGSKPFGDGAGHPFTSEKQPDEQVPVWECQEGCPVKTLDEQSGELGNNWRKSKANGKTSLFGSGQAAPASSFRTEESNPEWECTDDCPVKALDEQSGISKSTGGRIGNKNGVYSDLGFSGFKDNHQKGDPGFGDKGGASRFFFNADHELEQAPPFYYCPKAGRKEREKGLDAQEDRTLNRVNSGGLENEPRFAPKQVKNNHPTVKPVKLMRYLVRLVTPKGGTVLDPFAGSGTTGVAAIAEGFDYILIEREAEYVEIAKGRCSHAEKG